MSFESNISGICLTVQVWNGIFLELAESCLIRIMFDHISGFISNDKGLFQTQMTVWISPSIVFLTSLEVIDLGGLISLSGTIPPTIGLHLKNLQNLYLYGNILTGSIPENIGVAKSSRTSSAGKPALWVYIPLSIGRRKNLKRLLLYSNQFSGIILYSIENMRNLVELDVHDNALTGKIPNKVGQMQALEKLDLSNNFLSGKVPSSLTNLTVISVLYLDTNYLEGTIPFPSRPGEMSLFSLFKTS
jgi:Leucine-rich repeat (LRR) protein